MNDRLNQLKSAYFFRLAAVYAVIAWLAIQVATSTFPYLGFPPEAIKAVIVLAIAGFPIVLLFGWLRSRPVFLVIAIIALVGGAWLLTPKSKGRDTFGLTPATLSQLTSSPEVEQFPVFTPDGKRIVFSRETNGSKQLFIRDLANGTETQLTNDTLDHIQPSVSPDGRTLLYVQGNNLEPADLYGAYNAGAIWRQDVSGGNARLLVNFGSNPSYSPDGKHIAYDASTGGPRRIWIADDQGRNARQLTSDASEAVAHIIPSWSADGSRIVFQSIEKNKLDIRVVDVASGVITKITDDLVRDADPAFLPSGREVVFSSPRGGGWNLWRVALNSDGTPAGSMQQLTTGAGQDLQAKPTADGQHIAFATLNQNADLWVLPVDPNSGAVTGEPKELIATTREDSRGSWSPDGKFIAFNSDRAGDMNLYIYAFADKSTRQLTKGAGGDFQPAWSPDGRQLAFFSSRTGNAEIWTIDVASGAMRQLTRDSALDLNPVYSHDGTRIAFQSDRGGHKEMWLMNADGTNQRQLTVSGVGDHFMEWSADDKTVYYHANGPQVLQVNVASGQSVPVREIKGGSHISFSEDRSHMLDVVDHKVLWSTPLTPDSAREVYAFPDKDVRIDYPRWSPDGKYVLFDRLKPTGGDIWMLTLTSGRAAKR